MKVEVLYSPGCTRCQQDMPALRAAAQAADPCVEWRELDIVEAIDYAVELGVLKPPAVAIDGELVFASLPSTQTLAAAMRARLKA